MSVVLSSSLSIVSAQHNTESSSKKMNKEHKMKDKSYCGKLNLTEDQQKKFDKFKLDGEKKILPIKISLNELKAKKQTLMSAPTVDKKEVNKIIKEMNDKKEQIQLIRTEQHINMRNILTEEQRKRWDKINFNKKKVCNHDKSTNKSKECKHDKSTPPTKESK